MEQEKKSASDSVVKADKKWRSLTNISTVILVLFILLMFFNPNIKASLIQGLMKVGLFQPDVPEKPKGDLTPLKHVSLSNVDGKTINVSDQKGKVVFMNFWATWCPPCIAEMPSINSLYLKYKDNENVVFFMIDVDGKIHAATAFIKKGEFNLPVYIPTSEIPEAYFSGSLPTTVILDKLGNIAFRHVGVADYSNMKVSALINKLERLPMQHVQE